MAIEEVTFFNEEDKKKTRQEKAQGRSAPALAWMKRHAVIAVDEHATYSIKKDMVGGMSDVMKAYLRGMGMDVIFSIQKAVWEMTCGGMSSLHDVCFSAPTGSGKTLAYALPVVNALYKRREKGCLRCVVVLPTRGLALQVQSVMQPLGHAMGLDSVAICGTMSVADEAEILMKEDGLGMDMAVFTPGRLVSHIESTHGFSEKLKNVSFLVIDEADRLLRQRYNDWIAKFLTCHGNMPRLVKFVVSATLTRDPSKLDILQLHAPRFVTFVQEENKYKLPSTLEESKVVVADTDKPAALCTVLIKYHCGGCIVFVSSVEAASTLTRLLNILKDKLSVDATSRTRIIREYSAATTPKDREHTLAEFRQKRCDILVCSDAITRGIDIQGVDTVINYDTPVYAKTYVHRAGRTARAGKKGSVITLLKKEDVRHFKDMLRKADNNYVTDEALDSDILRSARTWVTDALDTMRTTTTTAHPANLKIHNQSKKDGVQKKRRKYSRFMPEIPHIPTLY